MNHLIFLPSGLLGYKLEFNYVNPHLLIHLTLIPTTKEINKTIHRSLAVIN